MSSSTLALETRWRLTIKLADGHAVHRRAADCDPALYCRIFKCQPIPHEFFQDERTALPVVRAEQYADARCGRNYGQNRGGRRCGRNLRARSPHPIEPPGRRSVRWARLHRGVGGAAHILADHAEQHAHALVVRVVRVPLLAPHRRLRVGRDGGRRPRRARGAVRVELVRVVRAAHELHAERVVVRAGVLDGECELRGGSVRRESGCVEFWGDT